jgi:hypothetical protein
MTRPAASCCYSEQRAADHDCASCLCYRASYPRLPYTPHPRSSHTLRYRSAHEQCLTCCLSHVSGQLVSQRWRNLLANGTGSETLCATQHVQGQHLSFQTSIVCKQRKLITTRLKGFRAKSCPRYQIRSAPRGAMRSWGVAIGARTVHR